MANNCSPLKLRKKDTMTTLKEAELSLITMSPFNTGTFSARWEARDDLDIYNVYTVYSYEAVIAEASYAMTPNNYEVYAHAYDHSKTTSKHANIVKKAWSLP